MKKSHHYQKLGVISASTLATTLFFFAPVQGCPKAPLAQPNTPDLPVTDSTDTGNQLPEIKQTSGEAEIKLAQYLKSQGVKLYGAYWCPHCHEQNELFGAEAFEFLPYIECASDGKASQAALCETFFRETEEKTGQISGYPTWVVKGKVYTGRQSLKDLAKHSGYQGSSEFKNPVPDLENSRPSNQKTSIDDFLELFQP
ncbi:MAG: hypothetical protein WA902_13825 [Thermosynechococcaceae cyanobacterium]